LAACLFGVCLGLGAAYVFNLTQENALPITASGLLKASEHAFVDGDAKEAKRLILLAERESVDDPALYKYFGILYEKMSMPERAVLHYQNYLKSNPDGPERTRIEQQILQLQQKPRKQFQ
jgi:hypothetical protein